MALYAFDGTWNVDDEDDNKDSNVVKFNELYVGNSHYLAGVGTRLGAIGRVAGGLFGVGGRTRIEEMSESLRGFWEAGDHHVDIIGFSRGAALAVHFANTLADDGIKLSTGEIVRPKIRFLGLWDLVGSFGLSFDTIIDFQAINVGWDIDEVPAMVERCCHAMALDERRESFNVTRLTHDAQSTTLHECWFRGVHSDVGGGNENPGRSNIPLNWMLDNAAAAGVTIDADKRKQSKYATCDANAMVQENTDPKRDKRRAVKTTDMIHETAKPKTLAVGESHRCTVHAKLRYNYTGLFLQRGGIYTFAVAADDRWADKTMVCGADGWKSEQLPFGKEQVVRQLERRRRCRQANWFELIGAYGDEDDQLFRLGDAAGGQRYKATDDGELWMFANDLKTFYGNNEGELLVTVERVG